MAKPYRYPLKVSGFTFPTMRKDWHLNKEAFDRFLTWLHPNREEAGKKYEAIRRNLIVIFKCWGCVAAEELADETFNRVISRVQQMSDIYVGDPAPYFYTVAHHLRLAYLKKNRSLLQQLPPVPPAPPFEPELDLAEEQRFNCLEQCMQRLTPADRQLVLEYYQDDKQAKIDHRKELAQRLGIPLNALRIRVYRIRAKLEDCIDSCLEQVAVHEMD